MKHGKTQRDERKGRAAWKKRKSELWKTNRRVASFVEQWADEMERQMVGRLQVMSVASDAFKEAGGFRLSKEEVRQAIELLTEHWFYGLSLKHWAERQTTWLK